MIPVLLPDSTAQLMPPFLMSFQYVDLSNGLTDEVALGRLVLAVKSSKEDNEIAQERLLGDSLKVTGDYVGAESHYLRACN